MGKQYNHLTYEERLKIKSMLDDGVKKNVIAKKMEIHISTLYREIHRGDDGDGYNPDYANELYQNTIKGRDYRSKIEKTPKLADYISDCIINMHYSPEKIEELIKEKNQFEGITVSRNTIYSAVRKGTIPNVTMDDLRSSTVKMFSQRHLMIPSHICKSYDFNDGDEFIIDVDSDGVMTLTKIE